MLELITIVVYVFSITELARPLPGLLQVFPWVILLFAFLASPNSWL